MGEVHSEGWKETGKNLMPLMPCGWVGGIKRHLKYIFCGLKKKFEF